jgi:elongation factor P
LTIVEADPAVPGQTAATSCKPAVLENGLRILAPPFIGGGEVTFLRRAD